MNVLFSQRDLLANEHIGLPAWIGDAVRSWGKRRALRRTLWELERLSDRQLDDLGLSRSDLTAAILGEGR